MNERRMDSGSTAFMLAQIGAHAATRFAERIAVLDLTPAQAGLLRAIARNAGFSQQHFATLLKVPPSRFVHLVDGLETRNLIERRRNETDRRSYGLHLTPKGEMLMHDLGRIGKAHDDDLCAGLDADQRTQLRQALTTIVKQQGLTPGVHPGYRKE